MTDDWQYTEEPAPDPHALCCARCKEAHKSLARLQDGLRQYHDWASRMPDAGFNSDDPRWNWWHERPMEQARALLAGATHKELA